eukprot:g518.t1
MKIFAETQAEQDKVNGLPPREPVKVFVDGSTLPVGAINWRDKDNWTKNGPKLRRKVNKPPKMLTEQLGQIPGSGKGDFKHVTVGLPSSQFTTEKENEIAASITRQKKKNMAELAKSVGFEDVANEKIANLASQLAALKWKYK